MTTGPGGVEGVVEATNANGIRIGGEWFNVSKFRPMALPSPGALVRVETDTKGFITRIDQLGEDDDQDLAPPSREAVRLAVLAAAATFAAGRPDMKSADVLTLAERWLGWVEGD